MPLQRIKPSQNHNRNDVTSSTDDYSLHEKLLSRSLMHPEVRWGNPRESAEMNEAVKDESEPFGSLDAEVSAIERVHESPTEAFAASSLAAPISTTQEMENPPGDSAEQPASDELLSQLALDIDRFKSRNFAQTMHKVKKDAERIAADRRTTRLLLEPSDANISQRSELKVPEPKRGTPAPAFDGKGGVALQCTDPS
jgi:hypothetical protein